MKKVPFVILGGGISGLVLALRLHQAGRSFLLLEGGERFGGNIRTEEHDGFLYDVGPDSFLQARPEISALCEELGLSEALIAPIGTQVSVAREGRLIPMPEGLALGVPTRVGSLLDTPLLSGVGKFRTCLEPFWPRARTAEEETIWEFTSRRLGPEMAERIAAPLLSGIFAGDPKKLSMAACFPGLVAQEKKFGSLFAGMHAGQPLALALWAALWQAPAPKKSTFASFEKGLGQLIQTLVESLPEDSWQLRAAVESVEPAPGGGAWVTVGGERLLAEHVIVTGAPWFAARVLRGVDEELLVDLGSVSGAPSATVFFGLDAAQVEADLNGSGYIVPPGEGEILAVTYSSSKWAGRAPAGRALVRAFLGGATGRGGPIEGQTDEELVSIAHRELTRLGGSLGPVQFARVYRFARGAPQPHLGHVEKMRRVKEKVAALPWLSLSGPGYSGVGIPDCVRSAQEVAEALTMT